MKDCVGSSLLIVSLFLFCICSFDLGMTAPANSHTIEVPRNRIATIARYHPRGMQFGRPKQEFLFNDFGEDDDIFELSKRQQKQAVSDDYGHLRFGRNNEMFDDYGHLRFGRNGESN